MSAIFAPAAIGSSGFSFTGSFLSSTSDSSAARRASSAWAGVMPLPPLPWGTGGRRVPVQTSRAARGAQIHRRLLIETLPDSISPGSSAIVEMRHHIDVYTRVEGLLRCRRRIQRDAVVHQFHDGGVVADDKTVETPLVAQHIVDEVMIRSAGTPLSALKELMTVAAPASIAALYGGR